MKTVNRPTTYNPGDYACVNTYHKSLWGWFLVKMIKYFTHSEYDHAFIIISENGDIVEAEPKGAQLANISKYDGREMQFSSTILTDKQRKEIVRNAKASLGTPYGFLDLIYLGLALKGIRWNWLFKRVLSDKTDICSQLVAASGVYAGVSEWLCGKEDPHLVTPADLDRLANAS